MKMINSTNVLETWTLGYSLCMLFFPSELLMESPALQLSGQLCVTKQSIAFSGTNALNHY